MEQYRARVEEIATLDEALAAGTELYREDLASGHITVLSEMITGSLDRPDLGPQIVERMQPWIDLTTDAVERILRPIGMSDVVAPRTVAYAIVALYLGIDLMSHLERDHAKVEEMFDVAKTLARLVPQPQPKANAKAKAKR